MKKIIHPTYLLLTVLIILMSACDRENMDFGKESNDYGQVNLASMGLSVNVNATPVSRAETVDPSNYIVGIYNAEDETLVSEWKYSELPEIFQLKEGKYKEIAHAPNVGIASLFSFLPNEATRKSSPFLASFSNTFSVAELLLETSKTDFLSFNRFAIMLRIV